MCESAQMVQRHGDAPVSDERPISGTASVLIVSHDSSPSCVAAADHVEHKRYTQKAF